MPDGLIHKADGTRVDPLTGIEVDQETHKKSTHRHQNIAQQDPADRNIEQKEKDDLAKAEMMRKQKEKEERTMSDGLFHNPDGTTSDPNTGVIVDTDAHKKSTHKHHIIAQSLSEQDPADRNIEQKEKDDKVMSDGYIHNADGSRSDPDTGLVISEDVASKKSAHKHQIMAQWKRKHHHHHHKR